MTPFPVHTIADAPEASRPALQALRDTFGFLPNIAGAMAGSPTLLQGFAGVFQAVHAGTFGEAQIQVLLLTNAVTNGCEWAAAFHSFLALQNGVAAADVEAIRARRAPADRAHAALSALARHLIETRGRAEPAHVQAFVDAGFAQAQVLEAILVVAASTITNYVGNVARPPLEEAFREFAWRA
jgi:alkylhydroperoxidase family enzyme